MAFCHKLWTDLAGFYTWLMCKHKGPTEFNLALNKSLNYIKQTDWVLPLAVVVINDEDVVYIIDYYWYC